VDGVVGLAELGALQARLVGDAGAQVGDLDAEGDERAADGVLRGGCCPSATCSTPGPPTPGWR